MSRSRPCWRSPPWPTEWSPSLSHHPPTTLEDRRSRVRSVTPREPGRIQDPKSNLGVLSSRSPPTLHRQEEYGKMDRTDQCPYCGQPITREQLRAIEARIREEERKR